MHTFQDMADPASFVPGVLEYVLIVAAARMVYSLRARYFANLPVLSYCFSFGFVATFLCAIWASHVGAFKPDGSPANLTGQIIAWILDASLGIGEEISLVSAALFLIFVPQLLSYLICGCFGRAADLILFRPATVFAYWSLIKTLALAAGIIAALHPAKYLGALPVPVLPSTAPHVVLSFILLLMALTLAAMHSDLWGMLDHLPQRVVRVRTAIHNWATQHNPP